MLSKHFTIGSRGYYRILRNWGWSPRRASFNCILGCGEEVTDLCLGLCFVSSCILIFSTPRVRTRSPRRRDFRIRWILGLDRGRLGGCRRFFYCGGLRLGIVGSLRKWSLGDRRWHFRIRNRWRRWRGWEVVCLFLVLYFRDIRYIFGRLVWFRCT